MIVDVSGVDATRTVLAGRRCLHLSPSTPLSICDLSGFPVACIRSISLEIQKNSSSPKVLSTVVTIDMTTSPWASSLPGDLVRLISSRLLAGDLLDYVRFRAVCHPWRSGTASPRGRGVVDPRFHPHRWMMLPEGHGLYPGHPKLRGYVRFFNLDTGAFVRVQIPLFEDHCVLDSYQGLLMGLPRAISLPRARSIGALGTPDVGMSVDMPRASFFTLSLSAKELAKVFPHGKQRVSGTRAAQTHSPST
nr:unnamed protein product [Digitaria exilis]